MEIKQLNNYKIEFYSNEEWSKKEGWAGGEIGYYFKKCYRKGHLEYAGLVSELSEKLAGEIVDKHEPRLNRLTDEINIIDFFDYTGNTWCDTAKQSFQTLSDLPYCVITKITN